MSAEDAYSLLEAIAEIHNFTDRLKRWEPNLVERKAEEVAEEIQLEKKARCSNWTFDDWQIPNNAELEYINNTTIKCKVANRRKIEFDGEILYMTQLARKITGNKSIIHGPGWFAQNFKYNGELIKDIEKRIFNNEK